MERARTLSRAGRRATRGREGTRLRFGSRRRQPLQLLAGWQKAGDPRLFRIIVSPENGAGMDLKEHARELVALMDAISERALSGRRSIITTPTTRTSTF